MLLQVALEKERRMVSSDTITVSFTYSPPSQ